MGVRTVRCIVLFVSVLPASSLHTRSSRASGNAASRTKRNRAGGIDLDERGSPVSVLRPLAIGMRRVLGMPTDESSYEIDGPNRLDAGDHWFSLEPSPRIVGNMEPVAPEDRVSGSIDAVATLRAYGTGVGKYVPPYLHPDSFPRVEGQSCTCTVRSSQRKMKDQVVQVLNGQVVVRRSTFAADDQYHRHPIYTWVPVEKVDQEANPCNCTGSASAQSPFTRWAPKKPEAGRGPTYELKPADATYGDGNYWAPRPDGGIVAPADAMEDWRYPNQAFGDRVPLPFIAARKERIDTRFARYFDQSTKRYQECDKVSKACTVPCYPGDRVRAELGNTVSDSIVVDTHVSNLVTVRMVPAGVAQGVPASNACSQHADCTLFRPCYPRNGNSICVAQVDNSFLDWKGDLQNGVACPPGTLLCRTLTKMVEATYLKKEGIACRAAFNAAQIARGSWYSAFYR